MSKRLEYWKAPETVRLAVGWLALLMGIKGVDKVFSGLFLFNGKQEVGFGEVAVPSAVAIPALILWGIALLLCALGLWRAQPWARWTAVVIVVLSLVLSILQWLPVLAHEFGLHPWSALVLLALAVPLSVIVFMLLPSTGRFFARVPGSPPRAKIFPS